MSPATVDTALDQARQAVVAARLAEHEKLEAVARLEAEGVAGATGYRSTKRLLEDLWHIDPGEAKRLVDQAAQLTERTTLSGQPLPPRMPATAASSAGGLVGDGHVRVVLKAMEYLRRAPDLDPTVLAEAEATLAEHATQLAPAGLTRIALRLIARLDSDGTAPEEPPSPRTRCRWCDGDGTGPWPCPGCSTAPPTSS